MFIKFFYRLSLCILIFGVSGCGGSTDSSSLPETAPVMGVVNLDGNPLELATVTFVPSGTTKGVECVGLTDASGKYSLKQIRGAEGVPPGEYRVVINQLVTSDGTPYKPGSDIAPITVGAEEALPVHYSNIDKTTLMANVSVEGGEFPFELKSRKKR
ncbi:MAG: carboxypeptidase-like regulatory domain-containing protein [Planctomycetes bacterium]|nr:carboxypeptidase-like regulatory domain-containing protein [Planctomycetota bacterium]MCH9724436.1 carboxypeptidase-like regulatory domain-containing protein [Planctomycetota bacterium]MCH9776304.1 carboxypeptidase-like regulatory domain-containing protein [Planctomycetota bacterium]MCH9790058.1 carboxypeptidase-like regulatory domain-containing protein [Planctomycetota bacterium]MDF1747025.1 carboxypeptidase-like regulatory domain-containing protein [Gimesia sp.]